MNWLSYATKSPFLWIKERQKKDIIDNLVLKFESWYPEVFKSVKIKVWFKSAQICQLVKSLEEAYIAYRASSLPS